MALDQPLTYEQAKQPQSRLNRARVTEQSGQVVSPYLTTREACDHLRFVGKHRLRHLYRFLQTKGVPVQRRSRRCLLIKRSDLDAVLLKG